MIGKITLSHGLVAAALILLPGVLLADTFQVLGETTDAHFVKNKNGKNMGSTLTFGQTPAFLTLTPTEFGPTTVSSLFNDSKNTVTLAELTLTLPGNSGGNIVLDDIYDVVLSVFFKLPSLVSPNPVPASGQLMGQLRHDPAKSSLELTFDPGLIDFTYGDDNKGSFGLLLKEIDVDPLPGVKDIPMIYHYNIDGTFTDIHTPIAADAVPEPSSIALLVTMVAGLFFIRKPRGSVGA